MNQDTSLVHLVDGEPRVSTMTIAEKTGNQHASVIRLVRDNLSDFQAFGGVGFEIAPFETAGGVQRREVAQLNEQQGTLLITYLRNTPEVRELKIALVAEFYAMRQLLTAPAVELTEQEIVHRALQITSRQVKALEAKVAEDAPKVDAYESFMDADGTMSVGAVAKMLGRSQNKLFDDLRGAGVLIPKGHMRNTPYQQYTKHFRVTPYSYERRDGTIGCSYTTTVLPSGVDFIRRKLGIPHMQLEVTP